MPGVENEMGGYDFVVPEVMEAEAVEPKEEEYQEKAGYDERAFFVAHYQS